MFEVLMDEFTDILDVEKKWQHNCCLGLKLQTHTHKPNYLQWSSMGKKKEIRELLKKINILSAYWLCCLINSKLCHQFYFLWGYGRTYYSVESLVPIQKELKIQWKICGKSKDNKN